MYCNWVSTVVGRLVQKWNRETIHKTIQRHRIKKTRKQKYKTKKNKNKKNIKKHKSSNYNNNNNNKKITT